MMANNGKPQVENDEKDGNNEKWKHGNNENNGKPWKTMENNGKQWKTMENNGKLWKMMENDEK